MHPRSRWPSSGHDALALVRPLLFLRREDTEAYCRAAGWQPVEDVSNRSPEFLRNRIRRDLLPELRRYNPKIEGALARLANAAREDLTALEELASPALLPAVSAGEVRLDRARLHAMPLGLRKHAIRLAVIRLLGDLQGLGERHIASIEALASGLASGGRLDLPRHVTATVRPDALVLARGVPEPPPALPAEGVRLQVPGEARLGGIIVTAGAVPSTGATASVSLDAGAVGTELCVRCWRPGDRMQPAGMTGTKKLQDIFVDARVPREERGAIPVFESSRGILWVGGLRLAEWARPRDGERTVLLSYREAP
jgi:tRNA(Ile)-lysidine synthase